MLKSLSSLLVVFLLIPLSVKASQPEKPKLIVLIVFDQMRADYLMRFRGEFLAAKSNNRIGGFNYLIENGAYYPYAQYEIMQSMTGPGHATISTGAYPYQMGIPLNNWYDSQSGKARYCVEDDRGAGLSPRALASTTIGDELKNADYPSKVVSVSLKDRAAILLGGHRADVALWFNDKTYQWGSSSFYFPGGKLPAWVNTLNDDLKPVRAVASSTENHLRTSAGYDVTLRAVDAALTQTSLGQGEGPDLLAVSFSSFDFAGHHYGPNSPEMKAMTLAADQTVSKLLMRVDAAVPGGLQNVAVALTADHGVAPSPDYLRRARFDAAALDESAIVRELERKLQTRFGKPANGKRWILGSFAFNFFLNHELARKRKVSSADLESALKGELLKDERFAFVFTESDYRAGRLPPGLLGKQTLNTYSTTRSGDVVALVKPFFMDEGGDNSRDGDGHTTHMTGYTYDRMVPLILSGRWFKPSEFKKIVNVVDIAPTIASIARTMPPALSEGRILTEALKE